MTRALTLVVALSLVFGSGCLLANVTTGERLREAVEGTNSEARWGRLDLASQRVHPLYREAWAAVREEWGDNVQIAGSEVTRLRLDDDEQGATSEVEVEWYSYDTMTLHHSTLEQRWQRIDGDFALLQEELIDGDEGLLAELPEELRPEEGEAPEGEGVEPAAEDAAGAPDDEGAEPARTASGEDEGWIEPAAS